MCNETTSPEMENLANLLQETADAYRSVANNEMTRGYGSIDKIYDCVRNSRNLSNKSRRARQFGSTY